MVAPASVTFVNPIVFSLKSHTDKLRQVIEVLVS